MIRSTCLTITSNCLIFHLLLHNNDICVAPKLLASVVVHDELKISAFASQAALPMHIYSRLLTNGSVASLSDLSNILVLCKSIAKNTFVSTQKCCLIDVALSALTLLLLRSSIDDLVFSVFTSNFFKLSCKIGLLKNRFVTLFFIRFS